ncbi:MAG TPA: gfo/Idh/MocA family oxidoreductase, partial [Propionibacteriaceae bacterium]|nr:gfo/Idh/MocA family oxidoreductase [Propionibacteriaceae bacterium]
IEFEGGATGTFTMTAFTEHDHRLTHIFGSQGRIAGDGTTFSVLDFRTGVETLFDPMAAGGPDAATGHGGGDAGLMDAFISAVARQDQSLVSSDASSTLSSHLAVFAAERSRRTHRVVRS